MEATGIWKGGLETQLYDGRGHHVTVDLPLDEGGRDRGTSALELSVVALAGCITTIFSLVGARRRLTWEGMSIQLTADRPASARTITQVHGELHLTTDASPESVATALEITLRTCPLGVLFAQAGIPVQVRPVVVPVAARLAGVSTALAPAGNPRGRPS